MMDFMKIDDFMKMIDQCSLDSSQLQKKIGEFESVALNIRKREVNLKVLKVCGIEQKVSLWGSCAKEIAWDALLEKFTQEREFHNYMRRATSASLFHSDHGKGLEEMVFSRRNEAKYHKKSIKTEENVEILQGFFNYQTDYCFERLKLHCK